MKIGDRVQLKALFRPTGTIASIEDGTMINDVVFVSTRFGVRWDDGEVGMVREDDVYLINATDDQLLSFTFRAECIGDINALFILMPHERIVSRKVETFEDGTPDRLCNITLRGIDLEALKRWTKRVKDGHVMTETIAESDKYTGERVISF